MQEGHVDDFERHIGGTGEKISSCSFASCTDGSCPWLLEVIQTSPQLRHRFRLPYPASSSISSFCVFRGPAPPCILLQSCHLSVTILHPSSHEQPYSVLDPFRGPATYTHFDLMLLLWCRKVLTVNESDRCQKLFSTRGHLVSSTAMSMMAPHWFLRCIVRAEYWQRRRALEAWLVTQRMLKARASKESASGFAFKPSSASFVVHFLCVCLKFP